MNNSGNITHRPWAACVSQDRFDNSRPVFNLISAIKAMRGLVMGQSNSRVRFNRVGIFLRAWHPSSAEESARFISAVCEGTMYKPSQWMMIDDRQFMTRLIQLIAWEEEGVAIPSDLIKSAFDLM